MSERHALKVPKGQSVGMSKELYEHLRDNDGLEIFGKARVSGYGWVGDESDE